MLAAKSTEPIQSLLALSGDRRVECQFGSRESATVQLHNLEPTRHLCHLGCSCHKCHTAAQKTWLLQKEAMKGICRTGLVLEQLGLFAFKQAMRKHIHKCMRVLGPQWLSEEAVAFRQHMIRLFVPPGHKGCTARRILRLVEQRLNGDWLRDDAVIHCCIGPACCANVEGAANKTIWLLEKLFHTP